ncbi:hypothetical protein MBAV_000235 [Candidatus Magnetobacterium bavaricum]|uniref:Uncharacterized protein n=1 Tax=Candidatus Magnetobacterium bavaricum TaxID=29290 RepID=A0A0F3H0F0_9BACT|nr:hypothetical protein MBAV_000235 [Candidatus Magnetobacterium bavaricum]
MGYVHPHTATTPLGTLKRQEKPRHHLVRYPAGVVPDLDDRVVPLLVRPELKHTLHLLTPLPLLPHVLDYVKQHLLTNCKLITQQLQPLSQLMTYRNVGVVELGQPAEFLRYRQDNVTDVAALHIALKARQLQEVLAEEADFVKCLIDRRLLFGIVYLIVKQRQYACKCLVLYGVGLPSLDVVPLLQINDRREIIPYVAK